MGAAWPLCSSNIEVLPPVRFWKVSHAAAPLYRGYMFYRRRGGAMLSYEWEGILIHVGGLRPPVYTRCISGSLTGTDAWLYWEVPDHTASASQDADGNLRVCVMCTDRCRYKPLGCAHPSCAVYLSDVGCSSVDAQANARQWRTYPNVHRGAAAHDVVKAACPYMDDNVVAAALLHDAPLRRDLMEAAWHPRRVAAWERAGCLEAMLGA